MIVDAQVHVWEAERPDRPWVPGGSAHRDTPLRAAEVAARMDAAGVDRAYLVGPGFEGLYNDAVLGAVDAFPDRFRAIVKFPIDDPSVTPMLTSLAQDPRVAGARLVFNGEAVPWLTDGTADWYWRLASTIGLPTMVFAPNRSRELAAVAERFPDLRVAVCHFGVNTKLRDQDIVEPLDATIELARFPNVSVKVTCAPSMTTEPYPHPFLVGQVRRVIDAFTPERSFWGSDLSRLRGEYVDAKRLFQEELGLSRREQDLVLGEAIERWFPWRG